VTTDFDRELDEAKGEDMVVHLAVQFLRLWRDPDPEAGYDDDAISYGFSPRRIPFEVDSFAHKYTAINDRAIVMYKKFDAVEVIHRGIAFSPSYTCSGKESSGVYCGWKRMSYVGVA
jgi:hypothetical protein